MIVLVPDYYPRFYCTAGSCEHTCCEGWEIDIDPASMKRYLSYGGEWGDRIRRCISEDPAPHFVLTDGERCPLLTENNLCELILRNGEESLCQICTDHPRFRNYWSDRIEMGLGLACEAAGRLILGNGHPMKLLPAGNVTEEDDLAQEPSEEEIWLREYRDGMLAGVKETGPAARLREYLIYRNLADALYDGKIEERIRFVNIAYEKIISGWSGCNLEDLVQSARVFSNEYEYDDEGLEKLLRETANG